MSGSLKAFIAYRIGNVEDAEDVLQEVLLRMYKGIAALNNPHALVPWAHQIARNAIADYYRHARATEPLDSEIIAPEPESRIGTELAGCLKAMVDELPEPYREAVLLVEHGGMSQRKYANFCGLSVSGAKTRVQRARRILKDKLLGCCRVELDRLGHIIDYQHLDDLERYCRK
ncbi:MAG: RNA polymerase sigma factor SigZ [Bacillota bacterium]|nr:RNA polymerase sigma factor SigZ [Bacillota bacterium]